MITTAADMIQALRRETFTGVVLYEGPSMLDGKPIVVIANRIAKASNNSKTGAMVQTFIVRSDIAPVEALKTGDDASVCGDCIHRPANRGSCYVKVFQSVRSTFDAFQRGRYARPGVDFDACIIPELFRDSVFRLGSYGDPAAAPFEVWQDAVHHVKAKAGYTHQWKRFPRFKALTMASCDSVDDFAAATAMGWRTFRVRTAEQTLEPKEVVCPASQEAGHKTTCASCRACGGTTAKAKTNIAIVAHGGTANRFAA